MPPSISPIRTFPDAEQYLPTIYTCIRVARTHFHPQDLARSLSVPGGSNDCLGGGLGHEDDADLEDNLDPDVPDNGTRFLPNGDPFNYNSYYGGGGGSMGRRRAAAAQAAAAAVAMNGNGHQVRGICKKKHVFVSTFYFPAPASPKRLVLPSRHP